MRLLSPHCPECGAPVKVEAGAHRATCEYCRADLVVEPERITHHRHPPPVRLEAGAPPPFPQPDPSLFSHDAPRFEVSALEQRIGPQPSELFRYLELPDERFALLQLRAVDAQGARVPADLGGAQQALIESLTDDGDPGLAANLALDALCAQGPFNDRLECAVALFEPRRMTVLAYNAGCDQALWWVSSEEGRAVIPGTPHRALERRHLREARDHFSNWRPLQLAAHDLVVMTSPAAVGHGLFETLNAHLGEPPLRVVTLAKNAVWQQREEEHKAHLAPEGDVVVAAVRALLPDERPARTGDEALQSFQTRRFDLSLLHAPGDGVRLLPLHGDRSVLVWLSKDGNVTPAELDRACAAVAAVLDRKDHGDNDNPRRAGRDALQALGAQEGTFRLCVVQLFPEWQRVKYFRAGFKQPLHLGSRGARGDGQQQFDEGGEATVKEGERLFFPGLLPFEGQHGSAESFSTAWPGGKASRLYEALAHHWKTKKTERALEKLAAAAQSDAPSATVHGLLLVTGT